MDDIRDAVLDAQADLAEIVRETLRDIVLPIIERQARMMWSTLPDEMKERFKAERPGEYRAFIEGMSKGE